MSTRIDVSPTIALDIRYSGPGSRGSRLTVTDRHSNRKVTVPYRHDLSQDERLRDAVNRWIERHSEHSANIVWSIGAVRPSQWVAVSTYYDK